MDTPNIDKNDVEIILNCKVIGNKMEGGQKVVFPCLINEKVYAAKFILLSDNNIDNDDSQKSIIDTIYARVVREIKIMQRIDSPYVVKVKKDSFQKIDYNNQTIIFYLEEWIEGKSLDKIIRESLLSNEECLSLCNDITRAISELWKIKMVHRDIKPQNIMRKNETGEYVLLDMGIAFDLNDKSLTQIGAIPGTALFLSPEQLDYTKKRDIDFRSDLFSLGVVMYLATTGKHPFYESGMARDELYCSIITKSAKSPISMNKCISDEVSDIICRLLSKQPNGRYRKCEFLLDKINDIIKRI